MLFKLILSNVKQKSIKLIRLNMEVLKFINNLIPCQMKQNSHNNFRNIILTFSIAVGCVFNSYAQKNCNNHSTGLVPITDLVGKQYRGFTGGKYSGGNSRSDIQLSRAINQAQKIKALDTSGAENNKTGKIIFAAIGASNPATEFNSFMTYCDTFQQVNRKLKLFNTCIGGTGIQKMNESTDNYWVQASKKLQDSGFSVKQVQVVWLEQENTQNADTSFPGAPLGLLADYQKLLSVILQKFPNVKIVYLNQRAYAGYVDVSPGVIGKGLHFPRDYYNGWTIKWLIEKQLNNEVGFRFSGSPEIPFIDWASSFWADGKNLRSDGLFYDCTTDFGGDGLHLSALGERKAGAHLFNYYKSDTISKYWFYDSKVSNLNINTDFNSNDILVYPNPAKNNILVDMPFQSQLVLYNSFGQQLLIEKEYARSWNLNLSKYSSGIYFLHIQAENGQFFVKKFRIN